MMKKQFNCGQNATLKSSIPHLSYIRCILINQSLNLMALQIISHFHLQADLLMMHVALFELYRATCNISMN